MGAELVAMRELSLVAAEVAAEAAGRACWTGIPIWWWPEVEPEEEEAMKVRPTMWLRPVVEISPMEIREALMVEPEPIIVGTVVEAAEAVVVIGAEMVKQT
jgi:hypothetical protein